MRFTLKMPSASAVVAGQTSTWKLPTGRRYHGLRAIYSGATLAQMTEIRVFANGEIIQRFSATERDAMNQFDGRAAAGGILDIPFDRYGLYSQKGEEDTAIQTGSADKNGVQISEFRLEIDIDAAASAPVIDVYAIQSNNLTGDRAGPGAIMRVLKYVRQFSAAGPVEIADLQKASDGPGYAVINRIFFKHQYITDTQLFLSNTELFHRTPTLNSHEQTNGVRVPQAGYFVFDTTEDGFDYNSLALIDPKTRTPYQDLRWRLQLSAADNITILSEYVGSL